jgi:hypothetical protein
MSGGDATRSQRLLYTGPPGPDGTEAMSADIPADRWLAFEVHEGRRRYTFRTET